MKITTAQQISYTYPVAIIGAGPAGLMAAETIAKAGISVHIYDAKPTVGRKFLLAGVGGMNITHAENWPQFIQRYPAIDPILLSALQAFPADALRAWVHDLGIQTFVGSSGKVFPTKMKAAPLLRAWLHRLRELPITFFMRHRCININGTHNNGTSITIEHNNTTQQLHYDTVVLALGGGSWPALGSTGDWQYWSGLNNIAIKPLLPSNCGFNIYWSDYFKSRFAGFPIKNAHLTLIDNQHHIHHKKGECMITEYGIEGSAIYALSGLLRNELTIKQPSTIMLDLAPHKTEDELITLFSQQASNTSLPTRLKKLLKLSACEIALLYEFLDKANLHQPHNLAKAIKQLALPIQSTRPIEEAISSAGGICFNQINQQLMLNQLPGVFCAGEMVDWEAPTGGYLLTACFATGKAAGLGVIQFLQSSIK